MQPLLWTTRSLRNLANELAKKGHKVCPTVVGDLLRGMGYGLQANSKTREGGQHIDRDGQFHYINAQAKAAETLFIQNRGQLPIALPCGACLRRSNHSATLCRVIPSWESRSTNSSRSVVIMTQLFMDGP
jgi:hypothetical protein